MTPELAPFSPNYHTTPTGKKFQVNRFNMQRCTWRVSAKRAWNTLCTKVCEQPTRDGVGSHHTQWQKNRFTSMSEEVLHRNSIGEKLFWIMFVFLGGAVGPEFLFMDDTPRPHRSIEVSYTLKSENIIRIQSSVYSPNLNPIEHAWDALHRRISQRTIPIRTVQ
ncbi:hypothetical protein TNCV_264461 [Trichonephila clavipes]|nr:hypothetical protein TNCV_264461 [Trichonephila clavipes]